ncbi:barstar family protein [Clostridium sp. CS001]|uniref:barstar family protein n=1 Tax=Clostridium sp. CS001 TaxID=2880648 RepID=UPI001CF5E92D|nr:barstar family protein [Clostridium sp. CS001]MCB2288517.1 barstar family protein [Clostridium sp. CS001]
MKEIRLNGNKMLDKASTHDYLKQKLDLPDYYGENLDALWDLLVTDFSPKKITIYRPAVIIENLGPYGEAIINLFQEVVKENEYIIVEIEGDKGI